MTKKILLITGGTGGHVIPALNFANYLNSKNTNCKILIDKRGYNYARSFKGKISIVYSSNLAGNFFSKFFGIINLLLGFIQSFFVILFYKPNIVISFGSYASFFPMICCIILQPFFKTTIFIHEQNSILGRTNKLFLKFINKLLLNFNVKLPINNKYRDKVFVVGSPEKSFNLKTANNNISTKKKFTIFIFGGSQGSEYIVDFALKLIKIINKENLIRPKFIIQSPNHLIKKLYTELKDSQSDVIIKDFYNNIDEVLQCTSVAISRAGAGSINDLIYFNIPSILIPLPTSKDNHQFYNALIMKKHNVSVVLTQKQNEINKAKNYIYEIHNDINKAKLIYKKLDKIKVKKSNALIYNLIKNEK